METNKYIKISGVSSLSSLGIIEDTRLKSYNELKCNFSYLKCNHKYYSVIPLHSEASDFFNNINKNRAFKQLDKSTKMAMIVAQDCFSKYNLSTSNQWVINAGSSRGATETWEENHKEFLEKKSVFVKSSPYTTLGNIASNVAQLLKLSGFQIDHSITCSSGLQSLANGIAWLKSGMSNHFLAIGTEAPLTDFTIAQMAALQIYSQEKDSYPSKPCAASKSADTFTLGEAAVALALETVSDITSDDILIKGIGTASELIPSASGLNSEGDAFAQSMKNALAFSQLNLSDISHIIPHSPGTILGDEAEKKAIEKVFINDLPNVISNKFLIGHTLGASGLMSLQLAYDILKHNIEFNFPYSSMYENKSRNPQNILINAMGFGGNAVSVIIGRN